MKKFVKSFLMAASVPVLLMVGAAPESPLGITLVKDAAAIVGMPLTPVSFAGVARRTTRRAVVYGAAEQEAVAQQQAATAQQQAAVAQQQAATAAAQRPAGAPAIGTIVSSLPDGCTTSTLNNVQYQVCGGVYYRAAFQSNNLVYVVTQP